jgi:hypothetical protein
LEADRFVRNRLDDLIVSVDTPSAGPLEALLEDRSNAQRFTRLNLHIQDRGPPGGAVLSIQDESIDRLNRPANRDAVLSVRHDRIPF